MLKERNPQNKENPQIEEKNEKKLLENQIV